MTQDEQWEYIQKIELETSQARVDAEIKAAEHAAFEQSINFMAEYISARTTLEILALCGLAKIER